MSVLEIRHQEVKKMMEFPFKYKYRKLLNKEAELMVAERDA